MDCLQAQEILSAGIDGEATEAELAAARTHTDGCGECASFARGLGLLALAQAPHAPQALIERLETIAAEKPVSPVTLVPRRPRMRFAAVASIAAVLLVGLVIGDIALNGTLRTPQTATTDSSSLTEDRTASGTLGAPSADVETGKGLESGALDLAAPKYVTSGGHVFRLTGPRTAPSSPLVAMTAIRTALGTGADPTALTAFTVTGETNALVLQLPDGNLLGFSAVTRQLGGRSYALTSDTGITAYGVWPALPARFPEPTAPDGSPTFVPAGADDVGVTVYVPVGLSVAGGFAIAPNAGPSDPAGGNPGWTWWTPLGAR